MKSLAAERKLKLVDDVASKGAPASAVTLAVTPAGTPTITPTLAPAVASLRHPPSEATLSLGFARDGDTTRLIERTHYGPLRVQKPLYPEGPEVCHAIVVHPPGGVVGGDWLAITARAGERAQALLTSPGAAKWYKANAQVSQQQVALTIEAGATLEWLPQETIFFDAAQIRLQHDVVMAADAGYIGSEILCFGRTAGHYQRHHGAPRRFATYGPAQSRPYLLPRIAHAQTHSRNRRCHRFDPDCHPSTDHRCQRQ